MYYLPRSRYQRASRSGGVALPSKPPYKPNISINPSIHQSKTFKKEPFLSKTFKNEPFECRFIAPCHRPRRRHQRDPSAGQSLACSETPPSSRRYPLRKKQQETPSSFSTLYYVRLCVPSLSWQMIGFCTRKIAPKRVFN